jgi:ATP synthase I chain
MTSVNPSGENPGAEIPAPQIPVEEQRLLAGMGPRIVRTTLVLGVAGAALFWLWRGRRWAGGFAVGAALSALSFQWMTTAVGTVADMAARSASSEAAGRRKPGARGAVIRFVLRYALIALAGYVIFRSSVLSLSAFFAGLFVAIAAVLVEIAYQVGRGFRNP